jgi:hypothetical protein
LCTVFPEAFDADALLDDFWFGFVLGDGFTFKNIATLSIRPTFRSIIVTSYTTGRINIKLIKL